jgi:hypothetical protein
MIAVRYWQCVPAGVRQQPTTGRTIREEFAGACLKLTDISVATFPENQTVPPNARVAPTAIALAGVEKMVRDQRRSSGGSHISAFILPSPGGRVHFPTSSPEWEVGIVLALIGTIARMNAFETDGLFAIMLQMTIHGFIFFRHRASGSTADPVAFLGRARTRAMIGSH